MNECRKDCMLCMPKEEYVKRVEATRTNKWDGIDEAIYKFAVRLHQEWKEGKYD